jgi:Rrf2 family transcriptional regulator, cysteine metabolism repressor
MKIPTRGRYGIRALVDVAIFGESGPVLLRDIAKREHISLLYLQQLVNPLISGGLIRSVRGRGGGISLSKPPSEITLSDVVQLLVGSMAPVECVNDPNCCPRSKTCATRDTWVEMGKSIDNILSSTSIQDLVERQRSKDRNSGSSYSI